MSGLLVVDDEEGVRRSLKRALEKDGYRIMLAENGWDALELVRNDEQGIETVICDYRMPGINGLETLIEIGRMNTGNHKDYSHRLCHDGKRNRGGERRD